MIVPPIWQTRYKGRIPATTFGTIFATPLYRRLHTPRQAVWYDGLKH